MRPAATLLQLAACLSSLTPLASAWGSDYEYNVVRRADDSATITDPPETATKTSGGKKVISTNLNTAANEETATGSETQKKKGGKKTTDDGPTHTTFAANDPPGGVSMLNPATTLIATPLFKIGDWAEFQWNYTSLQGTPTAIDILVSCSAATSTWTLTQNMTFETKPAYYWDTSKQADDPEQGLLTELYTLIIKDSDAEITDTAEPGYLGTYSQFVFGLYEGKKYTPLADFHCAGCSAASSETERQAIGLALTMSLITVCTFTWFATGFGLH